ncbi:hypothetical protein CKA32_006571 [Geitlerinema sp. FC II]|nr:hypothetical protein [Geitlerinema sp. CS-897]PPT10590.1 hypothetical protein CKA32_006571 [Geitlerinema sp. FC II]
MGNSDNHFNTDNPQLQAVSERVRAIAQQCDGDAEALLELLRLLERLHRDICEEQFQPALPKTRQSLYACLREIELKGGWPYIPRMRMRTLLAHIEALAEEDKENEEKTAT